MPSPHPHQRRRYDWDELGTTGWILAIVIPSVVGVLLLIILGAVVGRYVRRKRRARIESGQNAVKNMPHTLSYESGYTAASLPPPPPPPPPAVPQAYQAHYLRHSSASSLQPHLPAMQHASGSVATWQGSGQGAVLETGTGQRQRQLDNDYHAGSRMSNYHPHSHSHSHSAHVSAPYPPLPTSAGPTTSHRPAFTSPTSPGARPSDAPTSPASPTSPRATAADTPPIDLRSSGIRSFFRRSSGVPNPGTSTGRRRSGPGEGGRGDTVPGSVAMEREADEIIPRVTPYRVRRGENPFAITGIEGADTDVEGEGEEEGAGRQVEGRQRGDASGVGDRRQADTVTVSTPPAVGPGPVNRQGSLSAAGPRRSGSLRHSQSQNHRIPRKQVARYDIEEEAPPAYTPALPAVPGRA